MFALSAMNLIVIAACEKPTAENNKITRMA
jgi:hypothetical protein